MPFAPRWRRCNERAAGGCGHDRSAKTAHSAKFGRSDRSAVGRWFWEIDRVLLLLVAILISIGLIAVAAASPAAGQSAIRAARSASPRSTISIGS